MNLRVLFFMLLNIFLGCHFAEAKLTLAYVTVPEEHENSGELASAKIRQAVIEVAGADWFKQLLMKESEGRSRRLCIYIGKDCDLILESKFFWDEESMLMVKKALDYLSDKNDTIIFSYPRGVAPYAKNIYEIINDYHHTSNKLIVGKFFQEDLEYFVRNVFIMSTYLGDDYIQDCKKYDYLPYALNRDTSNTENRKFEQKDLDFYFEYLLKEDKKILSRPLLTKLKAIDYSYKYDERAGIRYVQEHILKENEIPDQNQYDLPIETLEINVEREINEILNAYE